MIKIECLKVCIGEDIYIVYQHRAVAIKEGQSMTYASTRIEQFATLIREDHIEPKSIMCIHIIDNLLRIVMDIDDYAAKACLT